MRRGPSLSSRSREACGVHLGEPGELRPTRRNGAWSTQSSRGSGSCCGRGLRCRPRHRPTGRLVALDPGAAGLGRECQSSGSRRSPTPEGCASPLSPALRARWTRALCSQQEVRLASAPLRDPVDRGLCRPLHPGEAKQQTPSTGWSPSTTDFTPLAGNLPHHPSSTRSADHGRPFTDGSVRRVAAATSRLGRGPARARQAQRRHGRAGAEG